MSLAPDTNIVVIVFQLLLVQILFCHENSYTYSLHLCVLLQGIFSPETGKEV